MCAYGLWRARYWAVLGFMVLLLLTILEFAVLLIRASNVLGVLRSPWCCRRRRLPVLQARQGAEPDPDAAATRALDVG